MTDEDRLDRSGGSRRGGGARMWLSAGAMTLGVGAAMVGGAAVASADSGSTDGPASSSSSSSSSASSGASEPNSTGTQSTPAAGSDTSTGSPGTAATSTATEADEPTATSSSTSSSTSTSSTSSDATKPSTTVSAQSTTGTFESSTKTHSESASETASAAEESVVTSPSVSAEPVESTPTAPAVASSTSTEVVEQAANPSRSSSQVSTTNAAVQTEAHAVAPSVTPSATQTITAWAPPALPTPDQVIAGLQQFGFNAYLTVMNQFYGVQRNLEVLRDDVATIFGIRQVVVTQPLPYGDPTTTVAYYVSARDYASSALATIAMVYGQLTGTTPDLQGIFDLAKVTDSIYYGGRTIYVDPTKFVEFADSFELLQDKNVRVITRVYGTDQSSKAFNDLTNGLQDPSKAMIAIIKGPIDGRTSENYKTVVVLGVDNVNGTVTINDPTRVDGNGLTMSVDDFMDAWSGWKYQLVTTQLASSPSTPPPAPSTTRLEWSLPRPDQIGQALQSAFSGIAQAFVHQIDGLRDNFADLGSDLGRTFGVTDPIDVTAPTSADVVYGNYARNWQYWSYQGNLGTCALRATAAVIAQLTGGGLPVDMEALAQDVIQRASTTVSGVRPGGVPMFENTTGTYSQDVVTLLNSYDLNADFVTYLKTDGNQALNGLTAALSQGQGAIVSVNNLSIYNAYTSTYYSEFFQGRMLFPTGSDALVANHAVVVLGVDLTKNVVYLNDSAWQKGQGLPIPLDAFMKAWQYSNFSTVTAELRTT